MNTIQVLEAGVQVVDIDSGGVQVIDIGHTPIPGPTGPQGLPGVPGVDGVSGGDYSHTQSVPALTWDVTHNLGYRPNVTVEDVDGYSVDALISWPTINTVICAFSATMAGKAYLS